MDGPLKELAKLEKLAGNFSSSKGKSPCVSQSLDSLLASLYEARGRLQSGTATRDTFASLAKTAETTKKDVDERQKEVYNALARYGKALDKKFATPLPSYQPLFASPEAKGALERTIAIHFLRTGQFAVADTFLSESEVSITPEMRAHFVALHAIIKSLKENDITAALQWTQRHRDFLRERSSPLEFRLHQSQYMRLLLGPYSDVAAALNYARAHFAPFQSTHETEIRRLMTCMAYLPSSRLLASPYADLAGPLVHADLEVMFATEYCASLGMSRQLPLRVVGDLGGGGALARIEKGRKVMRERKSEWSQSDELPIEIPLAAENRYHSIFACPVSKEQSTEQNPPMMMTCGHVISKDSLQKLSKPGG